MIDITNLTNKKVSRPRVKKIAGLFFKKYGLSRDFVVSMVICSDEDIRRINYKYRKKDETTDILAFPKLNEIFINVNQIVRQAREKEALILYEFDFILVHGLLHLIGFEDDTEKKRLAMIREGENFLKEINWSKHMAFTLIELMVGLFIITLVSSLVLVNYNVGFSDANLVGAQTSLHQNIKNAQSYALSNKSYDGVSPVYWGINFSASDQKVTFFADLNGNGKVDSGEADDFLGGREIVLANDVVFRLSFDVDEISVLFENGTGGMSVYNVDDELFDNLPWHVEVRDKRYDIGRLIILESPLVIDTQKCFCNDATLFCCSFCNGGPACIDFESL